MFKIDQAVEETDKGAKLSCPYEFEHIWIWFLELSGTRQNGMGVNPITYQEIHAWSVVNELVGTISQFEIRAIKAIDRAFLVFQSEKESKSLKAPND